MKAQKPLPFKIIGQRPEHIPAEWAIHNATRLLYGDQTWQGDFIHGAFYAAVAPQTPDTAFFEQENALSGAVELQYVLPETAIAEQMAYYQALGVNTAGWDLSDPEIREKALKGWGNRQRVEYERAYRPTA